MSHRLVRPVRLSSVLRATLAATFLTLTLAATSQQRPASGQSQSAVQVPAVIDYNALPLAFEANRGQADSSVRFLAHGNGYSLLLTDSEAVLELRKRVDCGVRKSPPGARPLPCLAATSAQQDVVRLKLAGASAGARAAAAGPKASGEGELPGRVNYFIGKDPAQWQTGVPTYAKVRYAGVYPGVDLVYYGKQRQLEYDFVVAPGADWGRISLGLTGAKSARIDAATGDLVIAATQGELRLLKPETYQLVDGKRVPIQSSFKLTSEDEIAFVVGAHDRRLPLVIDPMLTYSTYLGGSGNDSGNAIAVDTSGSAYVTGVTDSANFPTRDPLQAKNGNAKEGTAFVTKFTPDGSGLVYSTYLGGTGGDSGEGIAVDADGYAYVVGTTYSYDFPTKNPLQSLSNGAPTVFVTKLSPEGSALVFSTYLGGSGGDWAAGIALGPRRGVFVTGTTKSSDFPLQNPVQATNNCPGDCGGNAFVVKIDAQGSALDYSTYLGGSSNNNSSQSYNWTGNGDSAGGIAVDKQGEAIVVGTTNSIDFPVSNALQPQNNTAFYDQVSGYTENASNGFVTKYEADGSGYVFSTYLGGSGFGLYSSEVCFYADFPGIWGDTASAVALDTDGNIYVTGSTRDGGPAVNPIQPFRGITNSVSLPVAWSGISFTGGEGTVDDTNAFVTEYVPDGSAYLFSTPLGGDGVDSFSVAEWYTGVGHGCGMAAEYNGDYGTGIAIDSAGSIYVTGTTGSTDFPVQNAFQNVSKSSSSAFITKINSSDKVVYSTYYGGQSAAGVGVDASQNAYITGTTSSDNLPATPNAFQTKLKGASDAYAAKITSGGRQQEVTFHLQGSLTYGTPSDMTDHASASSGLPVHYAVVFGPATMKGNIVTPTWITSGLLSVVIEAYQPGNGAYHGAAARISMSVKPVKLIVAAENASMAYGSAVPALKYYPITSYFSDGFSDLTGQPKLSTKATSRSAVGTYPITISQGSLVAVFLSPNGGQNLGTDPNYAFAFKDATLTITKAELAVTAKNVIIHRGQRIEPKLSYDITGLVNGDDAFSTLQGRPTLNTAARIDSPPGTYPIKVDLGTLSVTNYTFRTVDGWITIVK